MFLLIKTPFKIFYNSIYRFFFRQISEINQELELSQVKIKTLEDSQLILKQKVKEAENKTIAAEECLQREQSSNSLGDLQHSPTDNTQRPHSPAISAGVNSLEDGMCGSIDWHQVSRV